MQFLSVSRMTFWDLSSMEVLHVLAAFKIFESFWRGMDYFVHEVKSFRAETEFTFLRE